MPMTVDSPKKNPWKGLTLQQLKEAKKNFLNNPQQSVSNINTKVNPPRDSNTNSTTSKSNSSKRYKRPIEVSSNKPHSIQETYGHIKKDSMRKQARDPRFSDLSGTLNDQLVASSYNFIDDLRAKEKSTLRMIVDKGKKPFNFNLNELNLAELPNNQSKLIKATDDEKIQAKKILSKLESQDSLRRNNTKFFNLKQDLHKKERAELAKGVKKPFFTTKSKLRRKLVELKSERKQQIFKKRKEQKLLRKEMLSGRIPERKI